MAIQADILRDEALLDQAREAFAEMVSWVGGPEAPMDHDALETGLATRGKELLRQLYQARLDLLSRAEAREAASRPPQEGTTVRTRSRVIESQFGRVRLRRLAYKEAGRAARYLLDEGLNLPDGMHSHPLRRRIVEEGRGEAWDRAVEDVDRTTGGHVPKRQAEEIAIKTTQDFEAFYAQRAHEPTLAAGSLLIGSSDCKGIRMVPEALRNATRKAAEAEKVEAIRGDPMAMKKLRSHDRRMAVVTAAWEQEAFVRTADDIVSELQRAPQSSSSRPKENKKRLPKPQNKRLSASVTKSLTEGVGDLFDELDRRDPTRARETVILVDGDENQQTAIFDHARRHERQVTIVLDIIHLIHYLYLAGAALVRGKNAAADLWVTQHLRLLLSRPVDELIATIEAAAVAKKLTTRERKPINKALRYIRRNATFMNYGSFLARGFPIATGIIEGACRHLIQDRLGITGARWDLPGAEAMLRLRALRSSDDWEAYWRFHREQEALRNHGTEL